jgi:hypothetical protein
MDMPTIKRLSIGPFFLGFGGGGGGGGGVGAAATVVVAAGGGGAAWLELWLEFEEQPQRPASTTAETITDIFFIVLQWVFSELPPKAIVNFRLSYHQGKSSRYETFGLPGPQIFVPFFFLPQLSLPTILVS